MFSHTIFISHILKLQSTVPSWPSQITVLKVMCVPSHTSHM